MSKDQSLVVVVQPRDYQGNPATIRNEWELNSQELLENALKDLTEEANRRNAWCCCEGEPISESGKRRQLAKVLTLLLVPVCVLLGVGTYFVAETVNVKSNNDYTRNIMEFSIELGQFMHRLQRERDQSVLYLSNIGPTTKTYLLQRYLDTDEFLDSLTQWPVELEANPYHYFRTKQTFKRYLVEHRNELDLLNLTIFDELEFYERLISVMTTWVFDAIQETRFATMWRSLVAYQKVVVARSNLGVERALGSNCLSHGGFTQIEYYQWYNKEVHIFKHLFKISRKFSDVVSVISEVDTAHYDASQIAVFIASYRQQIQYDNVTRASPNDAAYLFDNMTNYIEILLTLQQDVAQTIIAKVDEKESKTVTDLSMASIILIGVVALIPVLAQSLTKITSDIQNYAITLADKTTELNREKKRTDSLLHQMLPKQVADNLKDGRAPPAEYFREVTVFFSDVVGFTSLTKKCTPMEIVQMLNELYILFDSRIGLYDVYKVETIKDNYMVASGLPERNGHRHAMEIANMALDLLASCHDVEIQHVPGGTVRLRVGIHTGPVVAGIVGSRLPRYCLFGDTVNTAARLETTGEPSRIHISSTTAKILKEGGRYMVKSRGSIDLKGKGEMRTYWLLGKTGYGSTESLGPEDAGGDAMSLVDLGEEKIREGKRPCNPTVSWAEQPASAQGARRARPPLSPIPSSSRMVPQDGEDPPGTAVETLSTRAPPSYDDIEHVFANNRGSPVIMQLTEGYHF